MFLKAMLPATVGFFNNAELRVIHPLSTSIDSIKCAMYLLAMIPSGLGEQSK